MDAAQKVLAQIDGDQVVRYAQDLIRFPTINPPGDYQAVATYVREQLHALGLTTEDAEGETGRPNIVTVLRGAGKGNNLCLSSHMDVVSPGQLDQWRHSPFDAVVDNGVLHGRGAADSKGMLAAMLGSLGAIIRSGVKLKGDLYFVAAVDDETAGRYGLRYAFETGQVKSEYVILGEGTQFGISHVYKGRIWIELEVRGSASHSAFPEKGINAIEKAAKVVLELYKADFGNHPILGTSTRNVGIIQGGQQLNVLPEACRFIIDIRWGPPLTSRDIRQRVAAAIAMVQQADADVQVGPWKVLEERDPLEFSTDSALINGLKAAGHQVFGQELPSSGWYSSGEVYHINRLGGLKTGVLTGPGVPWAAHAPNESIEVTDMVNGARLYALTALEVCGVA